MVDALEVLLSHVAYAIDQYQDADCVLVRHLKLAADDLEIETRGHRRLAAALEGGHAAVAGLGDALLTRILHLYLLLAHALNHLARVRDQLLRGCHLLFSRLEVHLNVLVVLILV
jgi:hypothetical protein